MVHLTHLALFGLLLLASCSTVDQLEFDETFLSANNVEFIGDAQPERKQQLIGDMYGLFKQRPNTRLFWASRRYFYYATDEPGDTSAFRRTLRRLGEEPAIYDYDLAAATAQNIENFMRNRGYFEAVATYDTTTLSRRRTEVTYKVDAGPLYTFKRVRFYSEDTDIEQILRETEESTLLEAGKPVDNRLYQQEVRRITDYLRNHGYAFFFPASVAPLEADSIGTQVEATLEVLPPRDGERHPIYTIGAVTVHTEYNPNETAPAGAARDTVLGGVRFIIPPGAMRVRPEVLLDNIFLRTGDLYRLDNYTQTNNELGSLGTYRFVSINQTVNATDPSVLDLDIYLTPALRYEAGVDLEVSFNQNRGLIGQPNLVGLSLSPSLSSRNLLGGAESFTVFGDFGIEVNPFSNRGDSAINTLDLRLQADLAIPRFTDYLRIWRGMNKLGITGDRFYKKLRETSTTQLSTSYNFISLLNFYSYNSFDFRYGFEIRPNKQSRLFVNHLGVDILLPEIQPRFQLILDANPFLEASFGRQLFTGFLFRDVTWTYTTRPNLAGRTFTYILNGELSGHEVLLANKLANALGGSDNEPFNLFRELRFAHYARLYAEGRYNRPLNPRNSIGARLVTGAVAPYAFSGEVPYVKQYFVGGPTSMRGWRERELGPGGFFSTDDFIPDSLETSPSNPTARDGTRFFFQTGELRLEANFEYRFPLVKFPAFNLRGALFFDAGNVWTFQEDSERPGSQFRLREGRVDGRVVDPFYKQIAVNSGMGFRLDFNYFLLRIDAGVQLRNPFPDPVSGDARTGYWINYRRYGFNVFRTPNYTLMLGLPF